MIDLLIALILIIGLVVIAFTYLPDYRSGKRKAAAERASTLDAEDTRRLLLRAVRHLDTGINDPVYLVSDGWRETAHGIVAAYYGEAS